MKFARIVAAFLMGFLALSAGARNLRGVPNGATPVVTGVWTNVTPSNANLSNSFCTNGNYGFETMQPDTSNPGTIYTYAHCQGIWKSTDYGATWTGPLSQAGTNAVAAMTGGGGITVSPNATAGGVPTIYSAFIRNYTASSTGFWKSTDGGVNWTTTALVPPLPSGRPDVYPPIVDPYNSNHLLMAGHEQAYLLESTDAGASWSSVNLDSGMLAATTGTAYVFFIDTGNSTTTAATWLWIAQDDPYGTWRTSNSGTSWTKVNGNTHPHGSSQIYQPDSSGVVFMAGVYGSCSNSVGVYVTCPSGGPSPTNAWGVLRSTDYGQTWPLHLGSTAPQTVVIGTSKNVYAAYGYPIGVGTTSLAFELGAVPATGTWTSPSTPGGLSQGPGQIAVVNDGSHNILLGAMHNVGLWRYIEP